ncbi:MAG: acetate kinase [Bacteroidetes bacterium 24-39-8]|jgi:acetate kinase|nr:MAG: acetate kinase [Sphingobacteriia bacterium 35-40-8]OYZ50925.1 MAG: acetate kinase [Bacteroidetes bacterium 24-39-8]OZA64747.1 MAG: acetate kinase [Sphingobacteriia bacterium 39-39-8]HQR91925.1 acetate kinase [Sediminibacterium sp.]HQS55180.1 acetate kinase [Sediminibacterium sp.]
MNIFVINSGSSSIKYQLISMPEAITICSGLIERIGSDNASIHHKTFHRGLEESLKEELRIKDHAMGLKLVASYLSEGPLAVIKDPAEIHAVGHRVVHGGENFSKTMEINEEIKAKIKQLFPLAPLHNPANFLGIEVAEQIFTSAKQVAVFDTAFHQTMPAIAYRMAIPNRFYEDHRIRSYGFHGTSHKYVSERAIEYLAIEQSKIITIHLGNGCSMTAIKDGKCVDHSMGLGPMNGLMMGTRAGDIDQSVIFYLVNQLGYPIEQIHDVLNKQSGMLGLTGFSDMRDVKARYEQGDKSAVLAYQMYAYHIKKYIGSFAAVLNGLDAIVFTGGVGENDDLTRSLVCQEMDWLGIALDKSKNIKRQKGIVEINQDDTKVKVLIVPTNEELEIAKQCYQLVS